MRKVFDNFVRNVFVYDLVFLVLWLVLSFTLYVFDIKFQLWFNKFLFVVFICLLLIGLVFKCVGYLKSSFVKMSKLFVMIVSFCSLCVVVILFLSSDNYENVVKLNGKKYIRIYDKNLMDKYDVKYYKRYSIFFRGTKVMAMDNIEKDGQLFFDENGKVIHEEEYKYNENDNYILVEDLEVLYEVKFDDVVLRFVRYDSVLGQRSLVGVIRSINGGKDFFNVSKDPIQVSNEAKFVFLNENLGFAINTGRQELWQDMTGMYVTQDGGKSFVDVKFDYHKEDVEAIKLRNLPYYDNGVLKLNTLVYDVNPMTGERENIPLLFISNDNGINWRVSD